METESAKLESVLLTILYGSLAVVTISGNLLVVVAFFKDKNIQKKLSNFFIVNLAFADLFCGFFIFLVKFGKHLWGLFQPSEAGTWPLGESECVIWITGGTCLIYASLCTVVVISYDRFLLVKDAIKYTVTTTRERVLKMVFATWIVAISYSVLTSMVKYFAFRDDESWSRSSLPPESPMTVRNDSFVANVTDTVLIPSPSVCDEDVYSYVTSYTAFIAVDFLVFFGVVAVTNSCVCLKLHQRARKGIFRPTDGLMKTQASLDNSKGIESAENHTTTTTESESKEETGKSEIIETPEVSANQSGMRNEKHESKTVQIEKKEKIGMYSKQRLQLQKSRRAVMSLSVLVAAFLLCWSPYYVVTVLYHSGQVQISDTVIDMSLDLIWFNSTINPFLYAMTNVRFKRGMTLVLKRYFRWWK